MTDNNIEEVKKRIEKIKEEQLSISSKYKSKILTEAI
jgi:hypothetical protein